MGKQNGTYKLLYIKVGTDFFPVGCLTENSFSENVEMLNSTTRENTDGWQSSIPTLQSYSISFSGVLDTEDRGGTVITYASIKTLKRSRSKIEWKIMSSEGGDTDQGYGYFTSLSDSASMEEYVSFNGEIEGFGEPIIIPGAAIPTAPDIIDMIPPFNTAKLD